MLTHLRAVAFGLSALVLAAPAPAQQPYSLSSILGFTYPDNLVAARAGQRIAWVLLQRGTRTISVADGPEFRPRSLVTYPDDGQEITSLQFSADGERLVYARGGDHGSNFPAANNLIPNPTSSPIEPKLDIWSG
ncbi:MAG: S9 family peptidase, partial [Gemmatimonadetes bacterium]|nr:S9 family peptidase [Gemmatimonadota bacterium]